MSKAKGISGNKSFFFAVRTARCPRCREGAMFQHPFHRFLKFSTMYKNCPVCNLRYEVEPGFFIGSMYISYAMNIAILFSSSFLIYHIFNDPEIWVYLCIIPPVILILLPFMFRYSRVLYIYWFGGITYENTGNGHVENNINHS